MTISPYVYFMNEVTRTSDTSLPTLIYALYFVALFTGVPFFIGVIIAYVARDNADPAAQSHFEHQIGIFWRVFLGGIAISVIAAVSVPLMIILVGFIGLLLAALAAVFLWIWTLVRCIRGVQASSNGQPYRGPYGWTI